MQPLSIQRLLADRGLTPEERREVLEDLFVFGKKNQASYLFRMSILLVLSTIITTSGLLPDSAAVVIGAMLVAPLMNPVMASAGAVVMGWPDRFYRALWLVALREPIPSPARRPVPYRVWRWRLPCGRWEGMYTFGSKSMDLEVGQNLNSGCEDNAVVEIFLEDLDRARAAYIDGGRLKITLAHGEGIIYFRKD